MFVFMGGFTAHKHQLKITGGVRVGEISNHPKAIKQHQTQTVRYCAYLFMLPTYRARTTFKGAIQV
jgi:hypothetical protein